ncbi:MAG: aldo/keto reductase, partial [Pseudomonadota bacterium]
MQFLNQTIAPLGMGCWPIGGAMYAGDTALGYTGADDKTSLRTIHAALDHGITFFDTAAAYGTGHSEVLLGQALKGRPEALVATKIGFQIDETTKQIDGPDNSPANVMPAINACLRRLDRDCIDLLLLHQNARPIDEANAMFDEMEKARNLGKIRSYGWSTDFSESAAALAGRDGFVAVEHAMNVFIDTPRIQSTLLKHDLTPLIRSPLAMGLLSGK